MSQARNRAIRTATAVLNVLAIAVACSESPLAPGAATPSAGPAALSWKDTPFDVDGDGKLSKEEKEAREAADRLSRAELDSLKKEWKAYQAAVKKGDVRAEILRCEPRAAAYGAKAIGPKGGEIKVGDHLLTVPAGALDRTVTIGVLAPTGPRAELEFQPHGLTFREPVEVRISYKGCIVPADADLSVLYVGNGWRVLEQLPSHDKKAAEAVTGLTDHFSGYTIGWSRTTTTRTTTAR